MKQLVILFFLCPSVGFSQILDLNGFEFSAGIKFEFGFNVKGGSYLSIGLAGGVKKLFYPDEIDPTSLQEFIGKNTFAAYQASVNIYYNSIGDHILEKFQRVNVDFTNTVMASLGQYYDTTNYTERHLRVKPFNSQTPEIIFDDFLNSVSVGSNFVMNSNHRNQRVGFANFNIARVVHIHYFNDGPPYTAILGDGFDRWWTGGGAIDFYFSQYINTEPGYLANSKITLGYDRFTGNVEDAFVSSTLFGFDEVPANDLKQTFYNRSKFHAGLHLFEDNFQISYVNLGVLLNDIQDKIHRWRNIPVHRTNSKSKQIFSINFHNSVIIQCE